MTGRWVSWRCRSVRRSSTAGSTTAATGGATSSATRAIARCVTAGATGWRVSIRSAAALTNITSKATPGALPSFVPQDVPALIGKIGRERFVDRLEWGFTRDEAWRYNAPNDQYWDHPVVQGNQQSMHFAFLFNWAGEPWQTQRWSRSVLERYYGCGVSNAYLGDEDQGQMSAWAILASLGLFQTDGGCRAEPVYEIASPMFGGGDDPSREALRTRRYLYDPGRNASRRNIYVQRAELNGKAARWILLSGGGVAEGRRASAWRWALSPTGRGVGR